MDKFSDKWYIIIHQIWDFFAAPFFAKKKKFNPIDINLIRGATFAITQIAIQTFQSRFWQEKRL